MVAHQGMVCLRQKYTTLGAICTEGVMTKPLIVLGCMVAVESGFANGGTYLKISLKTWVMFRLGCHLIESIVTWTIYIQIVNGQHLSNRQEIGGPIEV